MYVCILHIYIYICILQSPLHIPIHLYHPQAVPRLYFATVTYFICHQNVITAYQGTIFIRLLLLLYSLHDCYNIICVSSTSTWPFTQCGCSCADVVCVLGSEYWTVGSNTNCTTNKMHGTHFTCCVHLSVLSGCSYKGMTRGYRQTKPDQFKIVVSNIKANSDIKCAHTCTNLVDVSLFF